MLLPPSAVGWVLEPLLLEGYISATISAFARPEADAKNLVAKWIWCEGEPAPENF